MNYRVNKFINDYKVISKYYKFLIEKIKNKDSIDIIDEWLIDNYYLVEECKNSIISDKKIINKGLKKSTIFINALTEIVNNNSYNISYKQFIKEINSYQRKNNIYFSYNDLSLTKHFLILIYHSKLSEICNNNYENFCKKDHITKMVNSTIDQNENLKITDFISSSFDLKQDSYYIFELNNQLRFLGKKTDFLFRQLNEYLESKNISLKNILNDIYQKRTSDTMLISNIFNNIKEIMTYDIENIYINANECEKILSIDPIYYNSTSETKALYRNEIIKLAKKNKVEEYIYLEQIQSSYSGHIGFYLFKNKSNKYKSIIYILSIFVLSILLSYILSFYFISSKILGFIVLLIPTSRIVIQIINHIIQIFVKPKSLPKMNYLNKLPDEAKTMVVIPTILSTTDKVADMFDKLETYYLMNKSDNLYFTLLGDVTTSQYEEEDYDIEISQFGKEYCEKLNKKYHKDIFNFVYRKRIWNGCENKYLGYERKRGALLELNEVLLHKMSKKDLESKFYINTLKDFNEDIKYVVTLDTDTEPVLNSIIRLIGCMAHPLNKPVLNKEKTYVVSGYAVMQPRVNADIEATNKSLYSQIFGGIGGFDTYSSVVPNLYQDAFKEGSFIGKGIYDLEIFDTILYNRFPDNKVLSHDLLEGNYLHCGYVSDVEFIDGFPQDFLPDASRQHRWARGDVQIINYILPNVKNKDGQKEKNPISLLGKWKILDNILRIFTYPSLLLIIILGFGTSKNAFLWLVYILLVISFSIITYLKNKLYLKKNKNKTVYYKNIVFGGKALLLRTYVVFSTIPYYSKLYLDAFIRSIYRLLISHKNLLNWVTAEEAEKKYKTDFILYLYKFSFNIILGSILLGIGIVYKNVFLISTGVIFITAFIVVYLISKDIKVDNRLDEREDDNILRVALKTWKYFEDNLCSEYNYLIPDNYQENRDEKLDMRTSPTNIGFSITSVISAYELEFISLKDCFEYLENIINSVIDLEKWNGHLYNWYNIKTKEVLNPKFISTVDSGNFVACLIVLSEFLKEKDNTTLADIVDKLIKDTNFKKLYTKGNVLSIGYDVNENHISPYNYNKFASESRLTSFISIAKKDIPIKHWFCLDKSLTAYKNRKGLISWSGTSFEYYMPFLFMKNYRNTLLNETYNFAYICQKSYIYDIDKKLPFGISESAYNELDNALNYKYKSFSVPYLKAKEEKDNRIVISPYSTLMALELYPKEIYENMLKFEKLNMLSKYGFYEAYDVSNHGIVRACFAHHQGMSLLGITNYLKDDIIKNYFHKNVNIKTFEILLKEKVQLKADINMKISKYKKYNYAKTRIENDIRTFNYISDMPEVSVLSNKKYCILMNDRGDSFSRYRTLQLNRYRKITKQDYGIFFYIKDVESKKIWSNTYSPINIEPDSYEVVFASDKIKYIRKDNDITTTTEIIVTCNHNAEIRKITFTNDSKEAKELEITSYTEPILSENISDISHKVFNNMFLDSLFDKDTNSLITKRISRDGGTTSYMLNRFVIEDPISDYSYETNRFNFVGRGNNYQNPKALNEKLTNYVGSNIEPIMSLRNKISIKPNGKKTIYFVCGFGRSFEQINEIINAYNNKIDIEKAYELSTVSNVINTKVLNITGEEQRIYNTMLNYLYQTTKLSINENRKKLMNINVLAQNSLWKFGISGDRPIILIDIKDVSNLSFVKEILKSFEYFKNKSIFVDIVIINSENSKYAEIIKNEIDTELYRMYTLNSFYHTPGNVYVLNACEISDDEMILLKTVPRLLFEVGNGESLSDKIVELQRENKISSQKVIKNQSNLKTEHNYKLDFDNSYGGFANNGLEYVIYNKNTPTPWVNIIANNNFGTIVTNNGCGYTYAYNSNEYKITSWTNEMIINDKSEGIRINKEDFDPELCVHGFGYSTLKSDTKKLSVSMTEFVAVNDNVKIYLVTLKNKLNKKQKIDLSYYINPTLGNVEDKTARHILSSFDTKDNYLNLRNVYSMNYSGIDVFMSSSEKINQVVDDSITEKSIATEFELSSGEVRTVSFILGCNDNDNKKLVSIYKYGDIENCFKELDNVRYHWQDLLGTIQVKTPDKSFDYMMNGWYLYQTISARIMARAGFYQVSGAFGYRDQLQDAMNICSVSKEFSKMQIINNASHQFIQGDVLHWWHDTNNFGLRSRYKDDYLWLVYATINYIKHTLDYSILDEDIKYIEGDELTEHERERGIVYKVSDKSDTLFNHCMLAINYSMKQLGPHNLPLIGGGDWNDGMNMVGIKGKGESVWLGFFLYQIIDEFIPIINHYDKEFAVEKYIKFNKKLKENLNTSGYDKDYYLRAYYDNGDKLGSISNKECKIDLLSQSFSILSGVCEEDNISNIINQVENNLVDKDLKLIKLLTPPFKNSLNNPGYIKSYPEGIRENGGQYTHATSWYIMALIKAGFKDLAYEYYQMSNPIIRSIDSNNVLKYQVEPYVLAGDIYSNKGFEARGGWTWYTGSSAWYYRIGLEEILGFKLEGNSLKFEPNIPKEWKEFSIIYRYKNAVYNIKIKYGKKDEILIDGIKKDKIILKIKGSYDVTITIKR